MTAPPELLSCQLCVLSRRALDAYDSDWIASVGAYIKVIASIGELSRGVQMPSEAVLREAASLLQQ